ncbi:DUF2244 domain-containing protein [Ottowia sp. GY511]|uniref:DUF2244 domain-containing protein n=1 Tax=Ottowia flava TaxID=2675430 RepID=A0ABW4KPP1_9BURK|nr:DUF2244 domain-containing protein [Ottowia sp. GY511]TXK32857.1 DUF2244 domain-containing protein [Ottowia sp. GY511]
MQDSSTFRFAHVSSHALAWRLRRNCSVTPAQLGWFYASLCLVSTLVGAWFWMLGAPLVLGFAGLELLALGVAILVYARHATDGETVLLQDGRLIIERDRAGRGERMEFSSAFVQVRLSEGRGALIHIGAHGRQIEVGRHVRPEWRQALAGEMCRALRTSGAGFGTDREVVV